MYKILGADQKEYGPVTADQVRQWIAEHRLNALSLVQPEGTLEWKPLSQLPEFASALASGARLAPYVVQGPLPATVVGVPKTNGMAIASLIMGLLSLFCCCFAIPCEVLGIIFGIVALNQINRTHEEGKGLAIAGIILCIVALFGFLLSFIIQLPFQLEQMHRQFKL